MPEQDYLNDIVVGETLVIDTSDYGFTPASFHTGDLVVVTEIQARASDRGWYVTVEDANRAPDTRRSATIGYEWLRRPTTTPQEAPMTLAIGTRVRVTDERTRVGNKPVGSGESPYVGQTATVTERTPDGSNHIKFDDPTYDYVGTWSDAALDIIEDEAPGRPVIHFNDAKAGVNRGKARDYARDGISSTLDPEHNTILGAVANGESVDAYALNEAVLAAMRSAATRHSASTKRRDMASGFAHLGHIVQAVLENHADSLPAYANGERSRAVADARAAVSQSRREIDALVDRVDEIQRERTTLTQAASDERRRLVGEIDNHLALIDDLRTKLAKSEAKAERAQVVGDNAIDYATKFLDAERAAMVRGFIDGVSTEYDYRQDA